MKLPYKIQQFWLRRLMWKWSFQCWVNLMFIEEEDSNLWFWKYLNDFDGEFL